MPRKVCIRFKISKEMVKEDLAINEQSLIQMESVKV